ncbi:TPA: hypothetical protein IUZ99_002743 [Enterococcus faecalis]|uniref:YodL domain-containing protein n=1 Tax=Bacilli TaxID=91061 RepID=UPI000C34EA71|nr:YodL domain-containing protein [Macrococcus caseolyticus]HAP5500118.1 hypothetical protein [Enterococcus faecalis]PKE05960.1 hypothetical protein CW692_10940 [Macrococcus caseolyticus]PKE23125.1 hypothetical protein CW689_10930 [Macrococcus caseolyticus]PKE52257.1 hypothetical protein CW676_10600 [Macrococcus caseolyticus]PKF37765.1 hypothetical protein CW681_10450 [Macrococcus caseolyticus]
MNGIQIKNNRILYYGNTAGYVDKGKAIVDPLFQNEELRSYLVEKKGLELEWKIGTFERFAEGRLDPEGNAQLLKKCRVWQLKPDADVMMKFIGYDELLARFGEPDPENYRMVYDGEVNTNDLEALYAKFNLDHPPGYEGHSLSMSDVVELYDNSGSAFHYVDRFGFKEVSFQSQEPEMYRGPEMSM